MGALLWGRQILPVDFCNSKHDVRARIHERWSLQRDEGRNPLHVLCSVESLSASFDAKSVNGPQATNTEDVPPMPLSPVRAWRHRHNFFIHLDDLLRGRLPMALVQWAGRPSKDPRSLDGCADSPPQRLPCTLRHRCVFMRIGDPHIEAEPARDPLSRAPPRRGTPS